MPKLTVWVESRTQFSIRVRYIHEDPVRRGVALTPEANQFSSAAGDGLDGMPAHLRN